MDHGFRKFFFTWCRHSGMDTLDIKWCMGRSLAVEDSYFKPDPVSGIYTNILEGHNKRAGYLDAIDWLTINAENRLKRENELLKVRKSEYEQLKEQVEQNKRSQLGLMEWVAGIRKHLGIPADKAIVWDWTKTKQGQISFCEEEEYNRNSKRYGP